VPGRPSPESPSRQAGGPLKPDPLRGEQYGGYRIISFISQFNTIMKMLVKPNTLTDAILLSMILGGRNALSNSEYILQNLSIDRILETQPEELTTLYSLSNIQAQNLGNFKSF